MILIVQGRKGVNPGAEALGDLPPLADVRKNRRIRWYRCPIESETLREPASPSDAHGLVRAVGHFAIRAVVACFTAQHRELCHTAVFRTKWLNEGFQRVFSFLGWLNFETCRFSHTHHHNVALFRTMNGHIDRHMFAGVPCYNLAKLHRAVARDLPALCTLTWPTRRCREWR